MNKLNKKIPLIIAILAMLAFSACGSNSSDSTDSSDQASTDPYTAMAVSDEEYTALLAMWPLEEAIETQGEITSYGASQQYAVDHISLNAQYNSADSSDALYKKYKSLIAGDWEDDEYSIGPTVYSGTINENISATCQIARSGSPTSVFLGVSTDDTSNTVQTTVLSHWPKDLIPSYEEMTDENQLFNGITIEPEKTISLSRSWSVDDTAAAMAFYKEQLTDYDSFAYDEGDEYTSPSIACKAENIDIRVTASDEMGSLEITYTRPYTEE